MPLSPSTAVTEATERTVLPLLADPASYRACPWDLREQGERRDYWVNLFRVHFPSLLDEAKREAADRGEDAGDVERRCEAAQAEFFAYIDRCEADPTALDRFDVLTLCWERERVLRRHGFEDAYRLAKAEQNTAMLKVLPRVLAELDEMPDRQRREELMRGVFAGNIYDQGATETNAMFAGGKSVDFHDVRHRLKARPWLCDDLDAWLDRLEGEGHGRALVFIDNAGPDIVLGMIPFCRELLRRGTRVILAANSSASLNDVTAMELSDLLAAARTLDAELDAALSERRLTVEASGNWAPLIDLTMVNPALIERIEAEPVDLLVLEGMGRAIETNFDTGFTCETLKLAMIKDRGVAEAIGGELYDLVLKYESARAS